ncbi:hypothetical protein VPHK389_0033 [Vibrio phage K389]
MSSVEFTLTYSFLAASGSDPVLTAALECGAIYRVIRRHVFRLLRRL